jgi:hypothetical protein
MPIVHLEIYVWWMIFVLDSLAESLVMAGLQVTNRPV